MTKIPEVRISFGYFLFNTVSKELAEKHGFKLKPESHYHDKTYRYWQAWQAQEDKILTSLQAMLGVNFYLPIIDVTCVPYVIPQAAPMIMNFKDEPGRFVDVLTHELCHLLLTDNNVYQEYQEAPKHFLSTDWQQMFGSDHDQTTLVHIPVHALLKYLWLDIMNEPKRYEQDKKEVKSYVGGPSYIKAWEYVDAHDYRQIVENLKRSYQEMGG